MGKGIQKQIQLPTSKAVELAWKNIRVRLARSLLVTSGIILALAFLTYILFSDTLAQNLHLASSELQEALKKQGVLAAVSKGSKAEAWWMVGLALMVSFVGILNAMLMSVTERFAEIGTMKCLGALDSLVIKLFLLESVFQGLAGTTIGVIIGLTLAFVEGLITYGSETFRLISFRTAAELVGICLLAGVALTVGGALYPAWRAAKMQPVDAMRTEV
jgi:ABC-type antimicrobial peptide transport system permease subunit